jgi:hypothetical protein
MNAKAILHKVVNSSLNEQYILDASLEDNGFLVVPGNGAPRWLIPEDDSLGLSVLKQWKPYGVISQLKWRLLCLLYKFNLLGKVPGIFKLSLPQDKTNNIFYSEGKGGVSKLTVAPVIYVGTPGPQQKAVVTLVDVTSKQAVAIMKVALTERAKKSVNHEASMLAGLPALGVEGVPELMLVDDKQGVSWQSVVTGKLSDRELSQVHVDWLLSMPKTGGKTSFNEQNKILDCLLSDFKEVLTATQYEQVEVAISFITDSSDVDFVLKHGDFAPWNIKQCNNVSCNVIDWEDAAIKGLPLSDLCHFNFIQAHLFDEGESVLVFLKSIEKPNSLAMQYINHFNISFVDTIKLILIYMLSAVLYENTSKDYRMFLIDHLQVVTSFQVTQ